MKILLFFYVIIKSKNFKQVSSDFYLIFKLNYQSKIIICF